MGRLILPVLLAMLAGCAKPTAVAPPWVSPPPGSLLSAEGRPLADTAVVTVGADFILLGESHTNLCDHSVQARLTEALATSGRRFAIGLEMLPVTAQPVLDRFNARRVTAENLGREIDWERLWGYPYAQYKPVFELAETFQLPVVALNIPRQVLTTFRDKGEAALSPAERAVLPRRIIPVPPAQKAALAEQVGMHQSMRQKGAQSDAAAPGPAPDSAAMADSFFLVQALWDSVMAEQALAWRERLGMPMLILAGGGHVEHGWGIEYRLRTLDPSKKCLAVMPVRDEADFREQTDARQRALPGDMVYFFCATQHKSRLGMNIVFEDSGMRVEGVDPGSRAARAGLAVGDVLLKANDRPLAEATDLHFAAMDASRNKSPLRLTIRRGQQTLNLTLPLD
jgi:uncharacterized iron-regulated protein